MSTVADFRSATPQELEALCNGVGPQYGGWLCKLIPLRALFDKAADEHDWDYWVGGGKEQYIRANLRFLAGCLRAVSDNSPLHYMLPHACMAVVYFLLVKWGGRLSFSWRPQPRTQEEMHTLAVDLLVKRVEAELDKETTQ